MKKKILPILISVPLFTIISVGAQALEIKPNKSMPNNTDQIIVDPFADDPFFQSHNDALQQMYKMQQAMDQFMKSQFSQMQNSLVNQNNQKLFGSTNNIEIKEDKNELIYKIRLPQGADSKVNVSVKDRQLIVNSNITQKITKEQDNTKSVSYSQSNYSQSFQLPEGYDPNSMVTKNKDSNLIVIFKKSLATSNIL
ncbi:Heat shock hsp20 [Legionella wadsworthii]|uniref:Heat shock hsp20 n=1 Tax=Legionella wadsworthii TaxID=28088 RepID=A0A378LUY0_9GAMM|nr:Hsp20 family protein [Legionella wadsworthii]STY29642.1 Heat shock hsp20 [Legionella wadsworthii]